MNKKTDQFFLLDDPSISGFSGGPVMEIRYPPTNNFKEVLNFSISPNIYGLVHGTINDKTGGFAAIVPAKRIIETIDLAPSFNGKYTFYYPNSKIWSERIYKNGIAWEVISNFNPEGKQQDKGTLKGGNGYLNIYNEKGILKWKYYYKNG